MFCCPVARRGCWHTRHQQILDLHPAALEVSDLSSNISSVHCFFPRARVTAAFFWCYNEKERRTYIGIHHAPCKQFQKFQYKHPTIYWGMTITCKKWSLKATSMCGFLANQGALPTSSLWKRRPTWGWNTETRWSHSHCRHLNCLFVSGI